MLRAVILTVAVCSALAISARAEDEKPAAKKRQLTEEQRAVMKEIRAKYDTNKDGKLDAEERKAMSAEDKEKLAKAGVGGQRKKKAE